MTSKIEFKINYNFNETLKQEWSYLTEISTVSIFNTYSWQAIWSKDILKNSLFIINIYSNKKIVAIIPFEKKEFLNFKTLSLTGHPFADYCDCIIDKKFFETNFKLKNDVHNYLMNLENIDLISFKNICENSNIHFLLGSSNFKKYPFSSYQLFKYSLKNENIISKKFKNDTIRQIKRLEQTGKLLFKIADNNHDKEKIFEFFLNHKSKQLINSNNWNYLNDDCYKIFLHSIFFNYKGHFSYLTLDNKIIAVHIGHIYDGKLIYLFPTYKNHYRNYSPGNILLYNLINFFFNNGGIEFDFTTGNEPYKIKLSNCKRNMFFKNCGLTFLGKIISVIILFLNNLKNINILKLIYNKIKY